jgi:hypothetical protein
MKFEFIVLALAVLVAGVAMRATWDLSSFGLFAKVGRYWVGVSPRVFPFILRMPCIAGGVAEDVDLIMAQGSYLLLEATGSPESPDTMEEIPRVESIDGGGATNEFADVTHLRSTGRRREWRPTFIDSGTLSFTMQYAPTSTVQARILALADSGERVALREIFEDGNGWDYQGYFQSAIKSGQTVGGKVVVNCVFKIDGVIDYTGAGSPA